ncbi:MAG: phosphodiester glycosidase family protein [Clostridiales bacterium]|nr:phosphodiester glycosidase family protein [Clostridiales bacterium]
MPRTINTIMPLITITPLPVVTEKPNNEVKGITYSNEEIKVNGRNNQIHKLIIDLSYENIKVTTYLSFDRIYGFETLSEMVKKNNAYAGITAGFFYLYGRPSGLVVNNGLLLSSGTGRFKSLIINKDEAHFETINTVIYAKTTTNEVLSIDTVNAPIEGAIQSALYNQYYGKTDRLDFSHTVVHLLDNTIMSITKTDSPYDIPDEGVILCFRNLPAYSMINKYDQLTLTIEPKFSNITSGYECSLMIVEDGLNIATDYDPWIGTLNQYDPRTCVGVDKKGQLMFVVVDGRQGEYSSGVTGKELADICIDLGLINVAMLDGGASAEMIVNEKIVNSLSYKQEERPLAGGFLIMVD